MSISCLLSKLAYKSWQIFNIFAILNILHKYFTDCLRYRLSTNRKSFKNVYLIYMKWHVSSWLLDGRRGWLLGIQLLWGRGQRREQRPDSEDLIVQKRS